MKKLIVLFCIFLASCSEENNNVVISKEEYKKLKGDTILPEYPKEVSISFSGYPHIDKAEIIMVDGCEYIIGSDGGAYNGGIFMTHKGNCKNSIHPRVPNPIK